LHESANLATSHHDTAAAAALFVIRRLGIRGTLCEQFHDAVLLVELCYLERCLAIQVLCLCVGLAAAWEQSQISLCDILSHKADLQQCCCFM
jgi:hypothetical protein